MMRILELGKFYPPYRGGMETLLQLWCEGFVACGAEVNCVVAHDRAATVHESVAGVKLHRLARYGTLGGVSLSPAFIGACKRFPADLWHAHFPNPLADVACLRGARDVPLVISYHSDVVRQRGWMRLYEPLMRRYLERADRIVVATPQHLEFSAWLGPWRGKCEVIPFGLPLGELLAPAGNGEEPVGDGGRPAILTVGRLVPYKGHAYLLEAMREVDAELWVVGTGPLEGALRAQAESFGMADRVHFLGDVSEAERTARYRSCTVFALASVTPNEAFGLVQVEAMAAGKPVVSCRLPSGVMHVNLDGETGLVVPPRDPSALAVALNRLLADDGLRFRMAKAGRQRARLEFSLERMLERYWTLFGDLVKTGRG